VSFELVKEIVLQSYTYDTFTWLALNQSKTR